MLRYHKICLTIHLYLYSSLLRISKLENLRISLSENPSLFLCTLFPGCKYVWNFENQSAGKYNFEFMSCIRQVSIHWDGMEHSLGSWKELNMNLLSTFLFQIQCASNTHFSSFLCHITCVNYVNFCDRKYSFWTIVLMFHDHNLSSPNLIVFRFISEILLKATGHSG